VTGDVFTFRLTDVPFTGEMTVSGDEMTGPATVPLSYSRGRLTLRRVSPGRRSREGAGMRTIAWILMAAALAIGSGCATPPDWIERTLSRWT